MNPRRKDGSLDSFSVDSMSMCSSRGTTTSHERTTVSGLPHHHQPTSSHRDSYTNGYNPNPNLTPIHGQISVMADLHIPATTNPTITETALKIATDVALVIQQVFPTLATSNSPPWIKKLIDLLASVLADAGPDTRNTIAHKLRKHLHLTAEKNLFVDLVAASALQLHPLLTERGPDISNKNTPMPNLLPSPLRERVATGLFVPMHHLLYGEALMLGSVCHVLPSGEEAQPEPYPLSLDEPPPGEFVMLIKRVDILRGLSTHAYTLAQRFPGLAGDMHGLTRHMCILLFADKLPATGAMELYDAFFREFQRQLSLLTLMPIDQFPSWLVESVVSRYTQPANSPLSPGLAHLRRTAM